MITLEEIREAFGDNRQAFKNKNVDHGVIVIALLRELIPYDECKSIIGGAEHDVLYLCDVNIAMKYLSKEDLNILADCNCGISDGYLRLFV